MNLKKITSKNPYGSVVIPAYNEEKNIWKTLESLMVQETYFPFNVIVVDNGSQDNTKKIAENYGAIVIEENRKWVKYARKTGIEEANNHFKSQIILQLDSDSIAWKYWIEEHLKEYKNKNTVLVWGWLEWVWRNIDAIVVINTIDFFKGRFFTLYGRKKIILKKESFGEKNESFQLREQICHIEHIYEYTKILF